MPTTLTSSNREEWIVAACLFIVVVLAGLWLMVVGVCGVYHDDAIYVSTAKAIAQGEGYKLINLPESPTQTKYPFLYPVLLAIIWKLWPSFPANLLAMQGLSLLAGAATVALSYLYLVRFGYCSRGVALASGLLSGTSAWFLYFSTVTLSETAFSILLILSLWALERQVKAPAKSRPLQFLLGVLITLPFLCRTIGFILVPVGIVLLYRSTRRVLWVGLGCLTGTFSWVFWVLVHLGGSQDNSALYYTDYIGWWSSFGFHSIARVFLLNLKMLGLSSAYLGLQGLVNPLSYFQLGSSVIFIIHLLGVVALIVLLKQLRQGQLLQWFLVGYLLIVCLWPWPPYRFIVPILPFFLAYLFHAIWVILKRWSLLTRLRSIFLVGLSILAALNLVLVYFSGHINRSAHYPLSLIPNAQVSWSSYQGIFEWLSKHSHPDDVIASGLDSMIYIYTDRRAFRPFMANPTAMFYGTDENALGTVNDLIQILNKHKPQYIVRIPMPGFSEEKPFEELLNQLFLNRPGWLKPVYIGDDQRFVIFEIQSYVKPVDQ